MGKVKVSNFYIILQAFDRHMNMVMENVTEIWTEVPKKGKKGAIMTK